MKTDRWARSCAQAVLLLVLPWIEPLSAQEPRLPPTETAPGSPSAWEDAYGDAVAAELVRLARERRAVVDARIARYETTAHERFSTHMRVAGMDRLLFRRETVSRIDWTRDTVRIELLGAREAQPAVTGEVWLPPAYLPRMLPALAFDPVGSEMLFRTDSIEIRHPLDAGSEQYYRYTSGDTATIRLPDGREVRILELRVIARSPDPRLINGSFWLEADTHAVVRMALRLSRPFRSTGGAGVRVLAPEIGGDIEHVAIEYGLWDLEWWLPRTMVARGVLTAAGAAVPISYERRYDDYRIEGATAPRLAAVPPGDAGEPPCRPTVFMGITANIGGPADRARRDSTWAEGWERTAGRVAAGEWGTRAGAEEEDLPVPACDRSFLVTRAQNTDLVTSPVFTRGIYDDEGGPVDGSELARLAELLDRIPGNPWAIARPDVSLLTPELIRFNRIEGLSLGGRAVFPVGPAEFGGELRVGTTGEVGGSVHAAYMSAARRVEVQTFRRLEAVEVASQPFSIGSTLGALLLGRDENDYFRATGAELRWQPAALRPREWELRLFAEQQRPVAVESTRSLRDLLDGNFTVRGNVEAERLDQAGATLRLQGAAGDDPRAGRVRGELILHGEVGDRTFATPWFRGSVDRIVGRGVGLGVVAAAGTSLREPSTQRLWQIGGAASVRGHDAASLRGESFWVTRGAVSLGPPAVRVSLFTDVGWAGPKAEFFRANPLTGLGVGVSLLDNLFRLDLARGLDGGGTRAYVTLGSPF